VDNLDRTDTLFLLPAREKKFLLWAWKFFCTAALMLGRGGDLRRDRRHLGEGWRSLKHETGSGVICAFKFEPNTLLEVT